jgi:hypothetical protein
MNCSGKDTLEDWGIYLLTILNVALWIHILRILTA